MTCSISISDRRIVSISDSMFEGFDDMRYVQSLIHQDLDATVLG